jgi:hyperosmotically inducible protein
MRQHAGFVFMAMVVSVVFMAATAVAQAPEGLLADRAAAAVQGYVHFSIFDDVNITVTDHAITLTGRVTMPFKRDEIAARVGRIDGGRVVINEIKVLPASSYDAKLRVRIAQAIYSHPSFWQYAAMAHPPIHIIVEGGRVTLTGRAQTDADRMLAYALAQVEGVLSIKNDLKLDKNQIN